MKFSAAVILAAAIGASAHPSHGHRNAHRSVGGRFVKNLKPVAPAPPPATTEAPAPPPATTTVVAPAAPSVASAAPSPSSTAGSGSGYKPFCGGVGKRATEAQIFYAGNTGTGATPGCNIMEIPASAVSLYDYTVTFNNAGGNDQDCVCWNKIGPDGGVNGFFKGNQAMEFKLPKGGSAYVAVDKNSQIGCSCGHGGVPTTSFGQFAGTWLEADFENESNQGWSGFDASCLVPARFNMDIPPLQVCGAGTCSTINQGGSGTNAYLAGMEAEDGIGGNVKKGPLALTVKVNGA
ncbi:allergen Asp F4-like protein [Cordyceps fumosorosea ARSEF 2679]|uniref:Allergen Asp F4-like protein n=1 Tax=Cordyceps fumosorosea (strain ARSEF 2679) TaxID=1081104 RepID=A0A162MU19_CORFA|nr:allergen Asp F4-like protein [Cordyceps fumosorosea ARSEF 2679]OAA70389.1 allergen Asp F4-like protein [Cordyceps fumosorosea ARSEF 2679]